MPRHSPCALISLTYSKFFFPEVFFVSVNQSIDSPIGSHWLVELCRLIKEVLTKLYLLPFWISLIIKSFPLLLPSHNIASIMFQCSVFKVHLWIPLFKKLNETSLTRFHFTSFPLCCLCFLSDFSQSLVVESTGIEPVTSCLQGRRSPSWANPPYRVLLSWSGGPKWTRTIDLTIISRVL